MSVLPTPLLLQVRRFSLTSPDVHGNDVPVFAAAVGWPVHGIAPGAMDEPHAANRDASIVAFTVYAPRSPLVPTERDRVVVDGVDYEVEGVPKDWTRGPWSNPVAGVVVQLRNVKG